MNWRTKILSVALLGFFLVLCLAYVRLYVAPKAHGVILLIAPASDLHILHHLENSVLQSSGVSVSIIPEIFDNPAQHFSTLSTSISAPADQIGLDENGVALDNLFYQAQRSGRRIGLISTSTLTHPAAAAFYAQTLDANQSTVMAEQLLDITPINVILGGSPSDLITTSGRNLVEEARLKGYEIIHSPQEIPDIPQWRTRLLLGLFDYPYALFDPEAHSTSPTLEEMVILSIECLQFNMGGYFLVAVHPDPNNLLDSDQLEYRKAHVYQLNTALQAAINYSGKNATVLLYVPQPGTTGVLIQLKGDATPAGILTLQQLHTYISSQL